MKIPVLGSLAALLLAAAATSQLASGSGTTPPVAQQAYLKASNTDPGDEFGFSVGASGSTLVVGAPEEASNATGVDGDQSDNSDQAAGAAYVFTHDGSVWSQQAYLKAFDTSVQGFGESVAVDGDTIVVGNGGGQSAHVFVRNASVWSTQAALTGLDTGPFDRFGAAVDLSGETLVVGAPAKDTVGAAYVFVRSGSTWTQQACLEAPFPDTATT